MMNCRLLAVVALLWTTTTACADEVPTDLVPFLRYIVQARAEHGLRAVVTDRDNPKYGTVYGGAAEDANIAWIAAAAYKYDWSRFHGDKAFRDQAFSLLDALARIHADGRWDDGGHGADFGLHSFAWAVLSWIESGKPDEARARVWREAVAAAADDALLLNHRDLLVADYANPDFYHLAGLTAAWKVTGDERYREEAAAMLRRYEDSLFDGGGVAYFLKSSPEHGYQQMVVKGAALYWDLTGDRLTEKGGFEYGVDADGNSPVLRRPAPWLAGDHVHVATHIHPAASSGKVHFKALKEAAAALLVEPDRRTAYLWMASLVRHWRQHELKVPPGATVRLFKRKVEMPRVPPDSNAVCSLLGGESAVWVIDSPTPLDPNTVLEGLHSGWGRGETRPERE